ALLKTQSVASRNSRGRTPKTRLSVRRRRASSSTYLPRGFTTDANAAGVAAVICVNSRSAAFASGNSRSRDRCPESPSRVGEQCPRSVTHVAQVRFRDRASRITNQETYDGPNSGYADARAKCVCGQASESGRGGL